MSRGEVEEVALFVLPPSSEGCGHGSIRSGTLWSLGQEAVAQASGPVEAPLSLDGVPRGSWLFVAVGVDGEGEPLLVGCSLARSQGSAAVTIDLEWIHPPEDRDGSPEEFCLDGEGSHDPDGDPLTYFWEIEDDGHNEPVNCSDPDEQVFCCEVPGLPDWQGDHWRFRLHVDDGQGGEDTNHVNIDIWGFMACLICSF